MGAKSASKRDQVALLLATGHSLEQVVALSGVGRTTIFRWQAKCPTFVNRMYELRRELMQRTIGKMIAGSVNSARRLSQLVKSDNERIALAAARYSLDRCLQETKPIKDNCYAS